MTRPPDDRMWPEFRPLWHDLRQAGGSIVVAGGYGLLLKQHWLLSNPPLPTIIDLGHWDDSVPRTTKDIDIVLGLDLIASAAAQARMSEAMVGRGFIVTERNPRWQFRKDLGADRGMFVEFHSPIPEVGASHLQLDKVRVKHKPSLGEDGVHGRQNPEAVGCIHHPFEFEVDELPVVVPHPVAWCVMKLIAMRDRWRRAEDTGRTNEQREFEREQAAKHAQDVCRAVAMATRDEADQAASVADAIRVTPAFADAANTCGRFFGPDGGWGARTVTRLWHGEDLKLLRDTLSQWFR